TRQQAGRVVTDDAPVAAGEELRAPAGAVDREMREHPRDVLRAARVLDVEEDGPPARGQRRRRRRRRDPRGKRGLGNAERYAVERLIERFRRRGARGLLGRRRGGLGLRWRPRT